MALTEMRTLMLWALLAKPGGAGLQKDIRPEMKKADRDALVSEGLIASVAKSRPIMLEVTDKGWAWAGDHLDAELPKRSVYGAAILQAWLKQLKTFMTAKGFVLADVLATPAAAPWMKISEAVDYLRAVAPARAIPIHQAVVAPEARGIYYGRLSEMTDADFQVLPEESSVTF